MSDELPQLPPQLIEPEESLWLSVAIASACGLLAMLWTLAGMTMIWTQKESRPSNLLIAVSCTCAVFVLVLNVCRYLMLVRNRRYQAEQHWRAKQMQLEAKLTPKQLLQLEMIRNKQPGDFVSFSDTPDEL